MSSGNDSNEFPCIIIGTGIKWNIIGKYTLYEFFLMSLLKRKRRGGGKGTDITEAENMPTY